MPHIGPRLTHVWHLVSEAGVDGPHAVVRVAHVGQHAAVVLGPLIVLHVEVRVVDGMEEEE